MTSFDFKINRPSIGWRLSCQDFDFLHPKPSGVSPPQLQGAHWTAPSANLLLHDLRQHPFDSFDLFLYISYYNICAGYLDNLHWHCQENSEEHNRELAAALRWTGRCNHAYTLYFSLLVLVCLSLSKAPTPLVATSSNLRFYANRMSKLFGGYLSLITFSLFTVLWHWRNWRLPFMLGAKHGQSCRVEGRPAVFQSI